MRILVVEDDEFNQIVLVDMLNILYSDIDIEVASNGEEALAILLDHNEFDLILTDINMPRVDGRELFDMIRSDLSVFMPIIAITAYAIKGDRENLLNFGFDDYISKPIDINNLKTVLDKYI
jgi:CheY-like chemotaxis protein